MNTALFAHLIGALYGDYRIERLDSPVFVAHGRYDYDVPSYLWDDPKDRLGNLRYKLYMRSGHTPPYEQPEEFTDDLVDWVRRSDGRPSVAAGSPAEAGTGAT